MDYEKQDLTLAEYADCLDVCFNIVVMANDGYHVDKANAKNKIEKNKAIRGIKSTNKQLDSVEFFLREFRNEDLI